MKRITCFFASFLMIVLYMSALVFSANYTEIDIGTKFGSQDRNFFGGVAGVNLKSNDVWKPALIDKNGNYFREYTNGMIFLEQKTDGNYFAYFSSWDSTDGRNEVVTGNALGGRAPAVMSDIISVKTYGEPHFPEIRGADYTVLEVQSEYPYLKYIYDSQGARMFDKPVSMIIDRGNVWLEAILEEDGSSMFINRLDRTTSQAPKGRYSTSSGVGAKLIENVGTVKKYGVYDEDENLIFTYTSDDYQTSVSDMIWVDGYCIVKKYDRYSREYYGIIDTKGNIVLPFDYAGLDYPNSGVVRAAKYGKGLDSNTKSFGLIDINGNEICEFKYSYISSFKNGIAAFRARYYRDRGGYIDMQGNELVTDCVYYPDNNTLGEYGVYVATFQMDENNDRVLYDKNGVCLTSRAYSYIGPFSEGLAVACIGIGDDKHKVGFLDTKGREVIPFIYDTANFSAGYRLEGTGPMFTNGATILTRGGHGYIVYNPLMTHGFGVNKNSALLSVNGTLYTVDAYNINGNNYFKLRDVAALINGSEKQFNVTWNEARKAVEIQTNSPYTNVGGELVSENGGWRVAKLSLPIVYSNGVMINEFDYETNKQLSGLTAYNIDGNNYFKFRDLGDFLDFHVGWDSTKGVISIDTSLPYVG